MKPQSKHISAGFLPARFFRLIVFVMIGVAGFPFSGLTQTADRFFPIELPLVFNDRNIGDVKAQVSVQQAVIINKSSLVEIIDEELNPALTDKVKAIPAQDGFVSLEAVQAEDIPLQYDPQNLWLTLNIGYDQSRERDVDLSGERLIDRVAPIEPAMFSAGVNLNYSQTIINDTPDTNVDELQPFTTVADGFFRVGKNMPLYLTYEYDYLEAEGWERVDTTLFYDDQERAIRYAGGDLTPDTIGFQEPVFIGGASVERQYDEIQPFRRTIPGGRSQLVLDQRSEVQVFVNGVETQTLVLDPGRYDVRNFPLVDGLNEVELIVRDSAGREERLVYDFFSDTDLLGDNITEFSVAYGAVRTTEERQVKYDGPAVFSGFYREGVTPTMTFFTYTQASEEQDGLFGAGINKGTVLGIFGIDLALDGDTPSDDYAAELSYTWRSEPGATDTATLSDQEFVLTFESTGDQFQPFLTEDVNQFDWELEGRYRTRLPYDVFSTVSAQHQNARDEDTIENQQRFLVSFNKLFGRVSATMTTEAERNDSDFENGQVFFSFNIPLGLRDTVRITADTDQNEITTEYARRLQDGADQYGARINARRSQDNRQLTTELEYEGNRFEAAIEHDVNENFATDTINRETTIDAGLGIGFADGHFAIGREALPGFLIAGRHPNISDKKVTARQEGIDTPQAYAGLFGNALVPIRQDYSERSFEFEVNDLPRGYNLENAQANVKTDAFTGYYYRLGSDDNVTVFGELKNAEGEPVALVSGRLVPVDNPEKNYTFFTNRTGRLVADSLASGEYELYLTGQNSPFHKISIPKDTVGIYDIGVIQLNRN